VFAAGSDIPFVIIDNAFANPDAAASTAEVIDSPGLDYWLQTSSNLQRRPETCWEWSGSYVCPEVLLFQIVTYSCFRTSIGMPSRYAIFSSVHIGMDDIYCDVLLRVHVFSDARIDVRLVLLHILLPFICDCTLEDLTSGSFRFIDVLPAESLECMRIPSELSSDRMFTITDSL
jgi:hypothetical protein